eukprot:957201_1
MLFPMKYCVGPRLLEILLIFAGLVSSSIHLRSGTITRDHALLLDTPTEMSGGESDAAQWLVELKRPVTQNARLRVNHILREKRYHLGRYIPDGAYLVTAPENIIEKLKDVPDVVAIKHFHHSFRIDKTLMDLHEFTKLSKNVQQLSTISHDNPELLSVKQDVRRKPGLTVHLSSRFEESSPATTRRLMRVWEEKLLDGDSAGEVRLIQVAPDRIRVEFPRHEQATELFESDDSQNDAREQNMDARAPDTVELFRVHRRVAKWLAKQHEVQWVEPLSHVGLLNDVATTMIQSNDRLSTPVWDHDIRGEGQVIAVGDIGLDWDMCFFYDQNEDLPLNDVNTNHRKIYTYHSFTRNGRTWDDHDSYGAHGTHTACSVAGDASGFSTLSKFNGIAYKAKLAIYDFGSESKQIAQPTRPSIQRLLFLSVERHTGADFFEQLGRPSRKLRVHG